MEIGSPLTGSQVANAVWGANTRSLTQVAPLGFFLRFNSGTLSAATVLDLRSQSGRSRFGNLAVIMVPVNINVGVWNGTLGTQGPTVAAVCQNFFSADAIGAFTQNTNATIVANYGYTGWDWV